MTEQSAGQPTPETPHAGTPPPAPPGEDIHPAGSTEFTTPIPGNMGAIALGFHLTVERALWLLLLVVAALTRLWDLAYRTQHHDEGIHTTFSWDLAVGSSYVHDPLSHGPFLFHANALVYFLLGSSDATSRLLPALFGIAIVAAPLLLRHSDFLGRWGALTAGTLLLFSPAYLYYTRFIRHDPYTILGTLLLVAAAFRFLQTPHRKWIILAFTSVAFLLTNHEIIFAVLLVFVLVLWGALVLSRMRFLIPIHLFAAAALMVLLALNTLLGWEPFPAIPWRTGGPEVARDYYGQLVRHPLVIGLLVVGIAFVAGCVWAIRQAARGKVGDGQVIEPLLGSADQGSVAKGVRDAWNDPLSVGIGALLGLWIFFGLFTTLFTQLNGIATGTYATNGTLLYWLGQQEEQRGEQPWFYFITEGFQYEWLTIFLSLISLVMVAVTVGTRLLRRDWSYDPAILFRVFLACWFLFIFAVLSWAGEKMPWLIMHILLPAALLSGIAIHDLVASARRSRQQRVEPTGKNANPFVPSVGLAALLIGLAGSFFLIAANLTQGGYDPATGMSRSVPADRLGNWWHLLLPLLGALIALGVVIGLRGLRPAIYGALTAAVVVMLLFQVHAGFRMSFLEGDVSIDTLIYNTVGPDAKQAVEDVTLMSELYLGDQTITVSNDNCTNWPLEWYFRDYENYRFVSSVADGQQDLPDVLIGVPQQWDAECSMPLEIPGYTSHTYVFRWHESEASIYRNFALAPEMPMGRSAWVSEDQDTGLGAIVGSVWSSIASTGDPDQQQELWRLLMYREQPGVLTEYLFKVYVRNDLLPYYNDARYGP